MPSYSTESRHVAHNSLTSHTSHGRVKTCSIYSISSSSRVSVAGGHAATKHQLDKTSSSLYYVALEREKENSAGMSVYTPDMEYYGSLHILFLLLL